MEARRNLAPAARAALRQSPIAALRFVEVHEEDGRIVLTGRLSCYYFKQLAQEAVLRVVSSGVEIQNDIIVEKKTSNAATEPGRELLKRVGPELVPVEV